MQGGEDKICSRQMLEMLVSNQGRVTFDPNRQTQGQGFSLQRISHSLVQTQPNATLSILLEYMCPLQSGIWSLDTINIAEHRVMKTDSKNTRFYVEKLLIQRRNTHDLSHRFFKITKSTKMQEQCSQIQTAVYYKTQSTIIYSNSLHYTHI